MALPHPALVRLAAGGDIEPRADTADELLVSAIDHGMQGLLWTHLRDRAGEARWRTRLAAADLATRQRHDRLWTALACANARLGERGIDVATAKGVTAEARWYERCGERPCHDVDLLIAPHHADRAADVVDALQPDHPLRDDIGSLVASGAMQSVNVALDGVAVDVHFDLLKLGVPTRQRETVWVHTEPYPLPDGSSVLVPDAEVSLIHFLVHLNKDSFAWLLGFADVARILRDDLDWEFIDRFLRTEGLDVVGYRSLRTVTDRLGLPASFPNEVSGPRAWAWDAVWPGRVTLLGSAGTDRSRRQDVIPFLIRGRLREAVVWAGQAMFPPPATVRLRYVDIGGPYPWRLVRGRVRTALERRAALEARRAPHRLPARDAAGLDPVVTARLLRTAVTNDDMWINVSGRSMGWSIPGGSRVRVQQRDRPHRGEVWAFCNDDGDVVVHRCRGPVGGGYRFQGDARVRDDGVVADDRLIGRITEVAPARARWQWSPLAGGVQRIPRLAIAAVARGSRRLREAG